MPDMSKLSLNGHDYTIKDAWAENKIGDLETDKEDVANKVTSVSAASTDVQYPTAKCLYDLFDKTMWLEMEYGDESAVIDDILAQGKLPWFQYNGRIFLYASGSASYYTFGATGFIGSVNFMGATCNRNTDTWSTTQIGYSLAISSSSTDLQLASAKSIYTFVTSNTVKSYWHHIELSKGSDVVSVAVVTNSSTPFDLTSFEDYYKTKINTPLIADGNFYSTLYPNVSGDAIKLTADTYPSAQGGTITIEGIDYQASPWTRVSAIWYGTIDNVSITDTVSEA